MPCLLYAQYNTPEEEFVPYRIGDYWGFSDRKGVLKIAARFDEVDFFIDELAKVKEKGLWGLVDGAGKQFLPCRYNIVYGANKKKRVVVCQGGDISGHGGKWGFSPVHVPNETEILLNYDLLRECGGVNLVGAMLQGRWGAVDEQGKLRIPIEYTVGEVSSHEFETSYTLPMPALPDKKPSKYVKLRFSQGLARVSRAGKWGYINELGIPVVPLSYAFVGEFSEGLLAVVSETKDGLRLGFVNNFHEEIIPLRYDVRADAYKQAYFSDGLALVALQGRLGYVNKKGKEVVPCIYAEAKPFYDGRAWVSSEFGVNARWKLINAQHDVLFTLPADCQLAEDMFIDGFIRVRRAGKENYLDKNGRWLLREWATTTQNFQQGTALVVVGEGKEARVGVITSAGKWSIKPQYVYQPEIRRMGDYIRVFKDDKQGIIDTKGRIIVPFAFDEVELPYYLPASAKLFDAPLPARLGKFWGYLNDKGEWHIPPQYENAKPFYKGLARVKYEGKWGYIDRQNMRFWQ